MIRFALVFALLVAAAQATEVNLLRGSERRLTNFDVCFGVSINTGRTKIVGPLPSANKRKADPDSPNPGHTPETCMDFCFSKYPHVFAHYHVTEHPGGHEEELMHCRCHPANAKLLCAEGDGTDVYYNKDHPDFPTDFTCPVCPPGAPIQ